MQAWLARYLANGFDATEAARFVNYSDPGQSGWENKKKLENEISQHLAERAMNRDEVLHHIGKQARGNMGDFVRLEKRVRPNYKMEANEEGEIDWKEEPEEYELMELDLRAAKDSGKLGLVKKVKFDKDGGVSFELYSAQTALDMLAKAHGIYSDAQAGGDGDFDEWKERMNERPGRVQRES